jgi:hypothetical protein
LLLAGATLPELCPALIPQLLHAVAEPSGSGVSRALIPINTNAS